jgi:Collagen triple helix repeat (20 copies)
MPVKIIFPAAGETVQTNTVPHVLTVRAIADSNLNTDVRFKLNGTIVGIDTSATTINVNGQAQYQYQFNIPIPAAGIVSIEAEDINPATSPATVRSTASVSFELKLNSPTITLAKTATTLSPNLVTATITNRPTGSSVRFTMDGVVLKEDSQSPYNVSVSKSGELKAELVVGGNVIQTASVNVTVVATPMPTPTPTPPLKGDKGDKGDRGEAGPKGDKGDRGIAGIPGDKGEKGDKGDKGDRGDRGLEGIPGAKGDTGPQGIPGVKGDIGATGLTGLIGPKGDTGATGATGLTGTKGDTGATGATGAQGIPGPKGDVGAKGDTGLQGIPGVKGDVGATGATGATGDRGIQGETGPIGPKGDAGVPGAAGTMVWSTPVFLPLSPGVTGSVTYQTCGKLARINVDATIQFAGISGMPICQNLPTSVFNTWFHSTAPIFKPNLTLAATGNWGLLRSQANNQSLVLSFDKIVNETLRCVTNFLMPIN